MNLLITFISLVIGFVSIILINIWAVHSLSKDWQKENIEFTNHEISKDASNLLITGFFYFMANVVCYFIHFEILKWILTIIGIIFCLPAIISSFRLIKQSIRWHFSNKSFNFIALSSILNTYIPLFLAINIIFI